jgi:ABC-type antimicrobial peptide transport system permease subunit
MKLRDALERLLWTFVAAFVGALLGSPLLHAVIEETADVSVDLSLLGTAFVSAVLAGLIAVANAVLIIARWRLSVLPNPGDGPPGLPLPPPPAPLD